MTQQTTDNLTSLRYEQLVPAPDNLRQHIDMATLKELAQSIEAQGLLQPLLVTERDGGYLIVAGHRRYAAVGTLVEAGKWDRLVPVIVREMDEQQRIQAMLVENLRRDDLDPIEEATGYFKLTTMGMKQKDLAATIGCSTGHVSKRLSLLALPESWQDLLLKGKVRMEDALEATKLADFPQILDEMAKTGSTHSHSISRAIEGIERERRVAKVADALTKRNIAHKVNATVDENRVKRMKVYEPEAIPELATELAEGDIVNVVAHTYRPEVSIVHYRPLSEADLKKASTKEDKEAQARRDENKKARVLAQLKTDHLALTAAKLTKNEVYDILVESLIAEVNQMNVSRIARMADIAPVIEERDGKKHKDYLTPVREYVEKSNANRDRFVRIVIAYMGHEQAYHYRAAGAWVRDELESVDWDTAVAEALAVGKDAPADDGE